MDKFLIEGGRPLEGTVSASGSKNAALPILLASLLTDDDFTLSNVPELRDISTTLKLLNYLGKRAAFENGTVTVKSAGRIRTDAPYDLMKQMRASVLVAGPLLARFKKARVPLPGGCAIGLRPVDIHLKGFEQLGAEIAVEQGDLVIKAGKLAGSAIKLGFPSVGATENLLMCSVLTPGRTTLSNIALEPEVEDLADCLLQMGARIARKKNCYIIDGVKRLNGVSYRVIPDRIETGTYLAAAAVTGGKITVDNCRPEHLASLIKALAKSGAKICAKERAITVAGLKKGPRPVSVTTLPHPGFPTDLQAQWMAYMCLAAGESRIREDIFENRFMHAPELARMGADIAVKGNCAAVRGVKKLSGASVMASDLRGGAALVLAALAARGISVVQRVYHIDRGYERMEEKLARLGARIKRIKN